MHLHVECKRLYSGTRERNGYRVSVISLRARNHASHNNIITITTDMYCIIDVPMRPYYALTVWRLSREKPRAIARVCDLFLPFFFSLFYSFLSSEAAREVDPYKVTTKAGDRLHPAVIVAVDRAFSLALSFFLSFFSLARSNCVRVRAAWRLFACATARNNVILNIARKGAWPAHDVICFIAPVTE